LAGANELGVGRTVKIHQKGIFLECTGDVILEDKYVVPRVVQRLCDSKIICELCRSYAVQATRESDKALNFKLFRYIEGDADSDSGGGSGGGAKGMNSARTHLPQFFMIGMDDRSICWCERAVGVSISWQCVLESSRRECVCICP
jgi:hypothetical protein